MSAIVFKYTKKGYNGNRKKNHFSIQYVKLVEGY